MSASVDAAKFFDSYASALASRESEAIARHWDVPALILSDHGAQPVGAIAEVEAFFAGSMAQYDGVAEARANIVSTRELSADVIACAVNWDHLGPGGDTIGGEAGHYLLRRSDGQYRIQVYTPRFS